MLPKDLLILIDSREKKPLPFPEHLVVLHPTDPSKRDVYRLHTKVQEMKAGDYALGGFETARLIERKGGAREVIQNMMTGDLDRWTRSLNKLSAACMFPLMFIEGSPSDLLSPGPWAKEPHIAMDGLMRMLDERGVPMEILPCATMLQRRLCGEWVARRLISGAMSFVARSQRDASPSQ